MKKLLCLSALVIFAALASSVMAQELDEFVYLPVIIKSPQPPDCNFYEPNDTPGQANWIHDGETQTHCIVPKTDVDWVKFSVGAESEMILEATDEGGDLELGFYDSNLDELDYSYSGTNYPARIDRLCGTGYGHDPLPAGSYYAKAEHWMLSWDGGEEIPSYSISLTAFPCPTPVVLTNHAAYEIDEIWDDLLIVGEVQNNSTVGLRWVGVVANLFNSAEQLIDTDTDTVEFEVLPPGEKTCFGLDMDNFEDWSRYEFEVPTYYETSSASLQNMAVYGDYGTYNPGDGSYRILGFVRNDNSVRVQSVRVIATLYNASGVVFGCGYVYANNSQLEPGQSTSFEMDFSGYYRDYADVASYRIQVGGSLQ